MKVKATAGMMRRVIWRALRVPSSKRCSSVAVGMMVAAYSSACVERFFSMLERLRVERGFLIAPAWNVSVMRGKNGRKRVRSLRLEWKARKAKATATAMG